ncbi:MAG: CDP-alcohol phosphatidyltransferase family protein [Chloroflexi bacterium]|nr:CDP-alcohol phosphatidyltransferase family protein [Chloroflexota bacterium]
MLSNLIEDWARNIAKHVGRLVAKTGLTPNMVTIIGFLLNFPVAYVLGQGSFLLGGFLILFAGAFDMLDGAVARATGKMTKFGAFLDSTLDRYSEIVVLLGLLLFYRSEAGLTGEKMGGSILVYIAITGSLMVSYVKARSEGLQIAMKGVGLLPRPERVVMLAIACILTPVFNEIAMIIVLWVLAVGTNLTAFQRIMYVWLTASKELKKETQTLKENKEKEDEKSETLTRKRWSFRRVDGR